MAANDALCEALKAVHAMRMAREVKIRGCSPDSPASFLALESYNALGLYIVLLAVRRKVESLCEQIIC